VQNVGRNLIIEHFGVPLGTQCLIP